MSSASGNKDMNTKGNNGDSAVASPRREKRGSREMNNSAREVNNPFVTFAATRAQKVRVLHRNPNEQLQVRNRDKWLNIEQATRLANLQKLDRSQMQEFKEKHGRNSTWSINELTRKLNEKMRTPISPDTNTNTNNKGPFGMWQAKQTAHAHTAFVQRGMLKPGVMRDPLYVNYPPVTPLRPIEAPVKISDVNREDDEAERGKAPKKSRPSAAAPPPVSAVSRPTTPISTTSRPHENEDSDVIILSKEDKPKESDNKAKEPLVSSGCASLPSNAANASASTAKRDQINEKEMKEDKYQVPGALGWYVHVPETKYNNQFIPVLPRFNQQNSDKA